MLRQSETIGGCSADEQKENVSFLIEEQVEKFHLDIRAVETNYYEQ